MNHPAPMFALSCGSALRVWRGGAHRRRLLPDNFPLPHHLPSRSYRIVVFGSDEVTVPTLQRLHDLHASRDPLVESLHVVCPGDRPVGRGRLVQPLPAKRFAAAHSLPALEIPYGVRDLSRWAPPGGLPPADLGVVVSFGYFMTPNLLLPLRLGAVNLHPSLLPRYRGAAPVPHAFLNGDAETGLTVMEIDPVAFDAGAVLHQERHAILPGDTARTLLPRLADAGADALVRVLRGLDAARARSVPQSSLPGHVTRAPKLRPGMGALTWGGPGGQRAWTVERALRSWRAFDGGIGIHTFVASPEGTAAAPKRLKLLEVAPAPPSADLPTDATAYPAGTLFLLDGGDGGGGGGRHTRLSAAAAASDAPHRRRLYLRLEDGWLQLVTVQPEFKKPMAGADFANGLEMSKGSAAPVRAVDPPEGVGA
jgi:methionyl-tRNA formyltransferase